MELISIIVPIYNVEKYLKSCLDSIVNQTYSNIEIILVNDCTKDNSMIIAQSYAQVDSRIKIINNKENVGLSETRNVGLRNSQGEYIIFVDSDDTVERDFVEKLYNKIAEDNVDFVVCGNNLFNDNNQELHLKDDWFSMKSLQSDQFRDFYSKPVMMDEFLQLSGVPYPTGMAWNKIFKASFIKNNNLSFPMGMPHEDEVFFARCLLNAKSFSMLFEDLYNYRVNRKDSIMGKQVPVIGVIGAANLIYDEIKSNYSHMKYKNVLYHFYNLFFHKLYYSYYVSTKWITFKDAGSLYDLFQSMVNNNYDYAIFNNEYYNQIIQLTKKSKFSFWLKMLSYKKFFKFIHKIFTNDNLEYEYKRLYRGIVAIFALPIKLIGNFLYFIKNVFK